MPKLAVALAVALAVVLAVPPVPAAADSASTDPKVVIIVGATEGTTSTYISYANAEYDEAIKWTSNVVKVYSPNATWEAVKAAVSGAAIVVYHGHGNGWPSPYTWDPKYTTKNGFGLNKAAEGTHYNNKYYGEPNIETLQLGGAVVLLHNLCYAAGNSEPGRAEPTLDVARQRVDNYASAFLRAGARAVIADGHMGASYYIKQLLTTQRPVEEIWRGAPNYRGNDFTFDSVRTAGKVVRMDPNSAGAGFYRAISGDLSTSTHPSTFVVPGAAAAGGDGAPVYASPALDGTPVATLAASTPIRVTQSIASDTSSTHALQVATLDGVVSGYVSGSAVVPRDSWNPAFWGVTSPTSFSPNGDGNNDTITLTARLSETASWRMRILSGTTVLAEATGSSATPAVNWDGRHNGSVVADGVYRWRIEATDPWGNGPLLKEGDVMVDTRPDSRLAGSDRYSTAAAISAASFDPGVPVAYIATGANFPDALAGAAVAGKLAAPVLLVTKDSIPAATAAELSRLAPGRIVVLGSAGVVSEAVRLAAVQYEAP